MAIEFMDTIAARPNETFEQYMARRSFEFRRSSGLNRWLHEANTEEELHENADAFSHNPDIKKFGGDVEKFNAAIAAHENAIDGVDAAENARCENYEEEMGLILDMLEKVFVNRRHGISINDLRFLFSEEQVKMITDPRSPVDFELLSDISTLIEVTNDYIERNLTKVSRPAIATAEGAAITAIAENA